MICVYEKGNELYIRLSEKKESALFSFFASVIGVLTASFIASAATAPFALFHFRQLPLYGIFASAIATTLTSFWIMPTAVAGVLLMPFGADKPFLMLASYGIEIVNRLAALSFGLVYLAYAQHLVARAL